jgi:hypothetical protein
VTGPVRSARTVSPVDHTNRRGSADQIERAVRANWFNGATRLARALGPAGGETDRT